MSQVTHDEAETAVWCGATHVLDRYITQQRQREAEQQAEIERLRKALHVAHKHLEMDAMEISHCKDAAIIRAALNPKGQP